MARITLAASRRASSSSLMSKSRFFFPDTLQAHQRLEMPDALAHYALRVLRLKNDAEIVVFDGQGGEYPARLEIEGKRAFVLTGAHDPREAELDGRITLVQGLPTGDKMDWIIEKSAELGACRVIPITAQRSVLQLRGERLEKRLAHWQRVAHAASEQCGRNRVLAVERPCSLQDYLRHTAASENTVALLCHPDYGTTLNEAIGELKASLSTKNNVDVPEVHLLIGPEGGWSDEELATARQRGIRPARFGRRILRTETAGLALIAAITALMNWD